MAKYSIKIRQVEVLKKFSFISINLNEFQWLIFDKFTHNFSGFVNYYKFFNNRPPYCSSFMAAVKGRIPCINSATEQTLITPNLFHQLKPLDRSFVKFKMLALFFQYSFATNTLSLTLL